MRPLLIALAVSAGFAAGPGRAAEAALAPNGMFVAGTAEAFEVFPRRAAAGTEVFCAAGDFARTHLNAGATERVEIVRPIGRSRTRPELRSVVFALRPPGSGRNAGLDIAVLRPGQAGVSRSVAFAAALCNISDFRNDD